MERMKLSFGDLYKVLRMCQEAASQFVDNPTYAKKFYKESAEAIRRNLLLDEDLVRQNAYAKMLLPTMLQYFGEHYDNLYKRKPWLKA
jgi:hypothetical protein